MPMSEYETDTEDSPQSEWDPNRYGRPEDLSSSSDEASEDGAPEWQHVDNRAERHAQHLLDSHGEQAQSYMMELKNNLPGVAAKAMGFHVNHAPTQLNLDDPFHGPGVRRQGLDYNSSSFELDKPLELLDQLSVAHNASVMSGAVDVDLAFEPTDAPVEPREKVATMFDALSGQHLDVFVNTFPESQGDQNQSKTASAAAMLRLEGGPDSMRASKTEVEAKKPPANITWGPSMHTDAIIKREINSIKGEIFFNRAHETPNGEMDRRPTTKLPYETLVGNVPLTQRNVEATSGLRYTRMPVDALDGEDPEGGAARTSRVISSMRPPSVKPPMYGRSRAGPDATVTMATGVLPGFATHAPRSGLDVGPLHFGLGVHATGGPEPKPQRGTAGRVGGGQRVASARVGAAAQPDSVVAPPLARSARVSTQRSDTRGQHRVGGSIVVTSQARAVSGAIEPRDAPPTKALWGRAEAVALKSMEVISGAASRLGDATAWLPLTRQATTLRHGPLQQSDTTEYGTDALAAVVAGVSTIEQSRALRGRDTRADALAGDSRMARPAAAAARVSAPRQPESHRSVGREDLGQAAPMRAGTTLAPVSSAVRLTSTDKLHAQRNQLAGNRCVRVDGPVACAGSFSQADKLQSQRGELAASQSVRAAAAVSVTSAAAHGHVHNLHSQRDQLAASQSVRAGAAVSVTSAAAHGQVSNLHSQRDQLAASRGVRAGASVPVACAVPASQADKLHSQRDQMVANRGIRARADVSSSAVHGQTDKLHSRRDQLAVTRGVRVAASVPVAGSMPPAQTDKLHSQRDQVVTSSGLRADADMPVPSGTAAGRIDSLHSRRGELAAQRSVRAGVDIPVSSSAVHGQVASLDTQRDELAASGSVRAGASVPVSSAAIRGQVEALGGINRDSRASAVLHRATIAPVCEAARTHQQQLRPDAEPAALVRAADAALNRASGRDATNVRVTANGTQRITRFGGVAPAQAQAEQVHALHDAQRQEIETEWLGPLRQISEQHQGPAGERTTQCVELGATGRVANARGGVVADANRMALVDHYREADVVQRRGGDVITGKAIQGPTGNSQSHGRREAPRSNSGTVLHQRGALLPQHLHPAAQGLPDPRQDAVVAETPDRIRGYRDSGITSALFERGANRLPGMLTPRCVTPSNSVPATPYCN